MLLVETRRGQRIVAHACDQAQQRGVRAGMTVAHATALMPQPHRVELRDHQPNQDAAALRALARWAMRFAPLVCDDPPDGLLLDVTGCERLYGSEKRLMQHVLQSLWRLGLTARAALAPTVGSAWAIARFARQNGCIIEEAGLYQALADLPAAALRLQAEVVDQLAEVGIDRIDQLLAIDRDALASRFDMTVLRRIDQTFGRVDEPIAPLRAKQPVYVERSFAGPVKQYEAIALTARQLVDALVCALERREAAARQVVLDVERYDAQTLHETLTLSRPSRDAKHLWALLQPRVERLHLGHGVERMVLRAAQIAGQAHTQSEMRHEADPQSPRSMTVGFSKKAHAPNEKEYAEAAGRMIDMLKNRLGAAAVRQAQLVESHIPEAAFVYEAPRLRRPKTQHKVNVQIGDRPTVLFDTPEPADVVMLQPEGPVVSLHWRGVRRVVCSLGPQRIGRRWWRFARRDHQPARDYYKLQDEHGRWLWVYRRSDTRKWFVHGAWM